MGIVGITGELAPNVITPYFERESAKRFQPGLEP